MTTLTTGQAAAVLGKSPRTIRKYVDKGKLHGVVAGHSLQIDAESVVALGGVVPVQDIVPVGILIARRKRADDVRLTLRVERALGYADAMQDMRYLLTTGADALAALQTCEMRRQNFVEQYLDLLDSDDIGGQNDQA